MRFLIVGAGALGGYYGGMLQKGGADVTFLVRPGRAAQLAEHGLVIREPDGEFRTPAKTVQGGAVGGPYDVVFLACKAYDLDDAVEQVAPALADDGAVLPVLNGINHIDILTDRLGAGRVLGGVTRFSVVRNPDGVIVRPGIGAWETAFGELNGKRSARTEEISAAFAAGGVPNAVSDKIIADLWAKFSGLAAAAAISTLTRGRIGDIARAPAGAAFVVAALDETARVAAAEGFEQPAAIRNIYIQSYAQRDADGAPSILYDMENGRPTEGDHIVGDMVRRADRLGVEVPILRAALCNLQIYEARRLKQG
jgi:2-dehydropantoate 2-reductase